MTQTLSIVLLLVLFHFFDTQLRIKPVNHSRFSYSDAMATCRDCTKHSVISKPMFFRSLYDFVLDGERSGFLSWEQQHLFSSSWFNYQNYRRIIGDKCDTEAGTDVLDIGGEHSDDNDNLRYALISMAGVYCVWISSPFLEGLIKIPEEELWAIFSYQMSLVCYYQHRLLYPSIYNK